MALPLARGQLNLAPTLIGTRKGRIESENRHGQGICIGVHYRKECCCIASRCDIGGLGIPAEWRVVTSNLVSTSSILMAYVWCFLIADYSIFPVDYDTIQTVGHLKKAIKEEKKQTLANVEADALILYRVDFELSNDEKHLEQVKEFRPELNQHNKLKSWHTLSQVFRELVLPESTIHILVIPPEGESIIGSSACSVVMLTFPYCQQPLYRGAPTIHYRPTYLPLIVYHSPITPLSSNIDLNAVRILCGLSTTTLPWR